MKPTDKQALTDYLRTGSTPAGIRKQQPSIENAKNGVVKTNTVKGSPRYGQQYIEASIGGRTVHRYALDGSQDVLADTQAFHPNTGTLNRKGIPQAPTRDARPAQSPHPEFNAGITDPTDLRSTIAQGNPLEATNPAHRALLQEYMKHNEGGDYGPGGPKEPRKTYAPMEHIGRDGRRKRKPAGRGIIEPSRPEMH